MVDRIRRFQLLNQQIFAVLNNYIPTSSDLSPDGGRVGVEHIRCFAPPVHRSLQQGQSGDV
jgi:cytoplasmic FMR1 interacting protein